MDCRKAQECPYFWKCSTRIPINVYDGPTRTAVTDTGWFGSAKEKSEPTSSVGYWRIKLTFPREWRCATHAILKTASTRDTYSLELRKTTIRIKSISGVTASVNVTQWPN